MWWRRAVQAREWQNFYMAALVYERGESAHIDLLKALEYYEMTAQQDADIKDLPLHLQSLMGHLIPFEDSLAVFPKISMETLKIYQSFLDSIHGLQYGLQGQGF